MPDKNFDNDESLVEACIKRDLTAWSAFIKKYSHLICASAKNRLKRYGIFPAAEEIEDIRQDILTSIWKDDKLTAVRNRDNIAYWISIVAGNSALDYMRKIKAREPVKRLPIPDNSDTAEFEKFLSRADMSPREELSRKEFMNNLNAAVESLPEKEKLVAKLNLFYGKKYEEIVEILCLPSGTVASYLKRAKEKLRKALKDFK